MLVSTGRTMNDRAWSIRTHDVNGPEFNLNIAADERRRRRDLNITSHLYLRIGHLSGAGHVPTYSGTGLPVPYTVEHGCMALGNKIIFSLADCQRWQLSNVLKQLRPITKRVYLLVFFSHCNRYTLYLKSPLLLYYVMKVFTTLYNSK